MIYRIVALLLIALAGCSNDSPPVPPQEPALAAELPWATQIEQVRSGAAHEISVYKQRLTDDDLHAIDGLTGLQSLVLGDTALTDASAERIARHTTLVRLSVVSSQWTAAALREVATLPKLDNLLLGRCRIDDDGFAELAKLTSLRFLILRDMPLTDASLDTVGKFSQLESFYLSGTEITESGLAKLQQQRPSLHIHGP